MPINPNIAMSYRGVEMPQQNALADYAAIQQIQSGQRQAEVSQMQLESLRRDQAALSKMQAAITAKGGPADLNVAADEMIKSGIPEYFKQGLTIKQTLDKQSRFASLLGPTGGAAPAAAPVGEPYPGYNEAIGMAAPAPAPAAPVNAMAAPAAAAPPSVNAMNLTDMRNKINQAYAIGTPEALAWAKAREEEMKPMTVGSSSSVYNPQTKTFTQAPAAPVAPAAPPSMVGEFNFAKTPAGGGFTGTFQQFVTARAAAGRAPRPEAAPRTQQVTLSDGSLGIVNMDTGVITPSTVGGAAVKGKDSSKTAVSEQQAAYNIGRVLTAANEIKNISSKDPSSAQPGAAEALAASVGMTGTANLARNANRQIVQGAQRDALDALLYLATGAAYNKEQLQGQMDAYIPAFTDKPEAIAAKKTRMTELIKSAKTRAGKAWTPEMDVAMEALSNPSALPAAATAPRVAPPAGFTHD